MVATFSGMTDPLGIKMLTTKRAELVSIIADLEHRLVQTRADLVHIDAALRIFDPTYMPRRERNMISRYPRSDYFEHGEITRKSFEVLREARGTPMAAADIVVQIMKAKGMDPSDSRLRMDFIRRTLRTLQRQAQEGKLERIGRGLGVRWRVP
jgi:hypothetical protein